MARKKPTNTSAFVLFDVTYEDGSKRSNRKIASSELGGLDADKPAKAILEAQDREIADKGGMPRGPIKAIVRSPNQ